MPIWKFASKINNVTTTNYETDQVYVRMWSSLLCFLLSNGNNWNPGHLLERRKQKGSITAPPPTQRRPLLGSVFHPHSQNLNIEDWKIHFELFFLSFFSHFNDSMRWEAMFILILTQHWVVLLFPFVVGVEWLLKFYPFFCPILKRPPVRCFSAGFGVVVEGA